jgi:hypothetical protein
VALVHDSTLSLFLPLSLFLDFFVSCQSSALSVLSVPLSVPRPE